MKENEKRDDPAKKPEDPKRPLEPHEGEEPANLPPGVPETPGKTP